MRRERSEVHCPRSYLRSCCTRTLPAVHAHIQQPNLRVLSVAVHTALVVRLGLQLAQQLQRLGARHLSKLF